MQASWVCRRHWVVLCLCDVPGGGGLPCSAHHPCSQGLLALNPGRLYMMMYLQERRGTFRLVEQGFVPEGGMESPSLLVWLRSSGPSGKSRLRSTCTLCWRMEGTALLPRRTAPPQRTAKTGRRSWA